MTSLRKRKAAISRALIGRSMHSRFQDRVWNQMRSVGREFGSPDFERLMDEDHRNGVGIFDPVLAQDFLAGVKDPDDMSIHRTNLL